MGSARSIARPAGSVSAPRPQSPRFFYRGGMASHASTTTRSRARRHGRVIALAVAVITTAGACTGDESTAPTTTAAQTTTTIADRVDDGRLVLGVYLPRTGPGAALGEPMIEAIERTVQEINAAGGVLGNDVLLELRDENTGTGMSELVDLGVDAIVGPASSTVALSQLDDAVGSGAGLVVCSPTATALALDNYPDNRLFFRTVPSDSLQMAAIATRAARTGRGSVSVGYLDDVYGRGLLAAFRREAAARGIPVRAQVGFNPDLLDLAPVAADLLAGDPGIVVVLGDADDGTRLLSALDLATTGREPPLVIVNEALRNGRQTIQGLSPEFLAVLSGVAPYARATLLGIDGFFTAHAIDCVNLIALSAVQAGSDDPRAIQTQMAAVSSGGRGCSSFADCIELLETLQIDYQGASGGVELSSTTGDLVSSSFEEFTFDAEGNDISGELFQIP